MRTAPYFFAAMALASLMILGCEKKTTTTTVDTTPLENSFKTAEPATQTTAQKAASAAKAGDYSTAMAELKNLTTNAKLTPEQQQSVKDLMAQIQQALAGAATNLKEGVNKTATDLQKSLPK